MQQNDQGWLYQDDLFLFSCLDYIQLLSQLYNNRETEIFSLLKGLFFFESCSCSIDVQVIGGNNNLHVELLRNVMKNDIDRGL